MKKNIMIKKFEEFVNENYGSKYRRNTLTSEEIDKLERIFIDEFGLKKELVRLRQMMVSMEKANGIYTLEEITEILYKVKSIYKESDYAFALLKHLFDERESVQAKQEALDYESKKNNGGIPLPIVIDINGKLITGKVYYCEALDAYAKDEDDFIEAGDEKMSEYASDNGILDDDQPDWVSDNWDMLDIYEVDLDKEYLDDTNGWTKR